MTSAQASSPHSSPTTSPPSEPAIASPNCPRQYGIFADEENCNTFWSCWAGEANKYECPPGLAYDSAQRVCVWADQVAACKKTGMWGRCAVVVGLKFEMLSRSGPWRGEVDDQRCCAAISMICFREVIMLYCDQLIAEKLSLSI